MKTPTNKQYWDWCAMRRTMKQVDITFEQWRDWWIATGQFDNRGNGRGQVSMSRIDKQLPFSLDNIQLTDATKRKT